MAPTGVPDNRGYRPFPPGSGASITMNPFLDPRGKTVQPPEGAFSRDDPRMAEVVDKARLDLDIAIGTPKTITEDTVLTTRDGVISVDAAGTAIFVSLPPFLSTPLGTRFTIRRADGSGNLVTLRPGLNDLNADGTRVTLDGGVAISGLFSTRYRALTVMRGTDEWWRISDRGV